MTRVGPAVLATCACLMASAPARAEFDPDEDRALRVTSESLLGIAVGTGGVFAGGALGWGVCALAGEDQGMFGCLLGAVIGAFAGGFAGIGLGAYAGGDIAGGNGGLGWTFLGETGGMAVSGLIVYAAELDIGDAGGLAVLAAGPLIGAVLGYELSTTREGPRVISASFGFAF